VEHAPSQLCNILATRTVAALQYPCNTHRRSTTISLQHSSRTASPCFAHHPPCAMRPSLLRLQPSLSLRSRPSIRFRAATSPKSSASARGCSTASTCTRVPSTVSRLSMTDHTRAVASMQNCLASPRLAVPCRALPRLALPCRAVPCRLEPRCPALPTFRLCWSCFVAATTSRSSRPCALTHRTILWRWPVVSIGRCRCARRTTSLARPSSDAGGPVPRGQS
jgi:hypothetical protein